MAEINIVTGHKETPHITAADDGQLNAVLLGSGEYVLNTGSKLACTVISSNDIAIADGDILMQGRHIRVEPGQSVSLTLQNGEQNKKRSDLIVCRYSKQPAGVEKAELIVITGTPTTGAPEDPPHIAGDIFAGDTLAEMPLYRIPLDGITVGMPVAMFDVISTALQREAAIVQSISLALPKTGGTVTGTLTQQGMFKLGSVNYGNTLPEPGNPGRIFFKKE